MASNTFSVQGMNNSEQAKLRIDCPFIVMLMIVHPTIISTNLYVIKLMIEPSKRFTRSVYSDLKGVIFNLPRGMNNFGLNCT